MAIRVALHHVTRYGYDRPVALTPQVIRLRPAPHCRTPIHSYSLSITPSKQFLNWQQDPYGNFQARVVVPELTRELTVQVDLIADLSVINPFDFFVEEAAEKYPFAYDQGSQRELAPYLEKAPLGLLGRKFLARLQRDLIKPDIRSVDLLVAINGMIHEELKYIIRMEPGVQTPEETLTLGSGSCRDFAWLQATLLRHLGLAARFVSGYSIQLVADQKPLEGPAGVVVDCCDLHAWTEAYIPGAGWIGMDATSGLMAAEGHIPLAATADPGSAAPITGAFSFIPENEEDKVRETFDFHATVRRVQEDPRVTKPYTSAQWEGVEQLGRQVDEDLRQGDVRLTMGGEPTFVSIDDMDSPEWNTAALGPHKRRLAGQLFRRLHRAFAPGGLLHFGQGKWYPGEQLPRWALHCYWRRDGQPIWEDTKLIAVDDAGYGHDTETARRFIRQLAQILDVDATHAQAGYEDGWYYLWREHRLPANVDPFDAKLEDPLERARLARIFDRGLATPVGYCLPLARIHTDMGPHWQSADWFTRRARMYLIPGDSPMGYRLPLDSLPWVAEEEQPFLHEMDPWAQRPSLPAQRQRYLQIPPAENEARRAEQIPALEEYTGSPRRPRRVPVLLAPGGGGGGEGVGADPSFVIRTAVCVEPRGGVLHVFMPPVRFLEDYLDLIAAVEHTASICQTPVYVEGYRPPTDYRLNYLGVTPDPGVIEVNMPPAGSWDELLRNTTVLYEEARQCRLGTEKFMMDGRHSGTGGGNHIIVGGATPADSPFLRRPDLLRSLVGYWHNHPALSYLFSGLFIGATSQAPRVDEGRPDAQYEMEIAFQQIPDPASGGFMPPWLIDRVMRHVLTDLTGNTHRSEFCIDKLYNPDSTSGRLGLVEMRAFEMPPHSRMSLTQHLLLRALLAGFWREPYRTKLVPWNTQLHGRFLLPHWLWQDFADVISDLKTRGYPLETDWFTPHLEFRCPRIGNVTHQGIELELRSALEPWNVLGEEPGTTGTVRLVDSSVERLQVLVNGMIDPRHVVACNGRRLPLHPTGVRGQYVAGVRYRAWQPASCLHPTIGVHAPLVFDVYDSWAGRSIGGCVYHVAHPGGRAFQTLPVNANEAESRRLARFNPVGHTPGPMTEPLQEINPAFPFLLDLRRS